MSVAPRPSLPLFVAPPGTRRRFSDDQVMLTLSLLAYRGFHDARPSRTSRHRMARAISRELETLPPVAGGWQLVWGPATYRSSLSLFDDSAIFVVKSRALSDRYAIVVRGTNPVSAFDWLFGDFWAGAATPWPFGDPHRRPGASVSLSTSLGLGLLRAVRSPGLETGPFGRALWSIDDEIARSVRTVARKIVEPMERTAALTMRHVGRELRRDLRVARRLGSRLPRDAEHRIRRLTRMWTGGRRLRTRLARRLTTLDDIMGVEGQLDLLSVMEGTAGLRSRITRGPDLVHYLRRMVGAAPGEVEIFVTGHSKGGALSIALAQFLADTSGIEWVGDLDRWDPDRRATIRCFSFAGPTPGNDAFAALVEDTFDGDCLRFSNPNDVVTHAWAVRPDTAGSGLFVDDIPWIYDDSPVNHIAALEDLATAVVADVAPLRYTHAGTPQTCAAPIDPTKRLFLDQVAHQHAAGYIEALGLGDVIDPSDFFNPLE